MRRLFIGLVVAATTVVFPIFANAANQEVAERIAANLRQGGQLHDYRIGVKYQSGTAWLRGHVADEQQLNHVLSVVAQTEGVDRVVNNLLVGQEAAQQEPASIPVASSSLRTTDESLAPEPGFRSAPIVNRRYPEAASRPAQRLQDVVDSKVSAPLPSRVYRAERLPASYAQGTVRQTAATSQVQPAPQPYPTNMARSNRPMPVAYMQGMPNGQAVPMQSGVAPVRYDQPHMPNCAWPSYAAYPNYAAVNYPKQYSPTAWPYIGPFYPYPQVPLGWRKVTLEWDDGWWMLDFKD